MHRVAVAASLLLALWTTALPAARNLNEMSAAWDGPRTIVEALADRFGPVEREPDFEALRPKLAKSGLVPSLIFDDTTAWTMRGDNWRAFDLVGYTSGGAYRIGRRAEAPPPAVKGQYRGRVRLQRPAAGRFEWTASDELAIGQAQPAELADALDRILRIAEHSTEASARAAIASALPRASAQFGLLLRLETLALQPDAYGAMDSTNLNSPFFTVSTTAALVALRWASSVVVPVTPGKSLVLASASRTFSRVGAG